MKIQLELDVEWEEGKEQSPQEVARNFLLGFHHPCRLFFWGTHPSGSPLCVGTCRVLRGRQL